MKRTDVKAGEEYLYRRGEHSREIHVRALEVEVETTARSWNGYAYRDRPFTGTRVKVLGLGKGYGAEHDVGDEFVAENRWIVCPWKQHAVGLLRREIATEREDAVKEAIEKAEAELANLWIETLDAIDYEGEDPGGEGGSPEQLLTVAELFCVAGREQEHPPWDRFATAKAIRRERDEAIEQARQRQKRRLREEVGS